MFSVTRKTSGDAAARELVTLSDESSHAQVVLAPERGALVTSFSVAGRELLYMDPATLRDPAQNVRGGIPVLFPSPGKLVEDTWQQAGRSGHLKQHGFARTACWDVARDTDTGAASVTLRLTSSARTLPDYPWEFEFELTLTLAGTRLCLAARVTNTSSAVMPFALGYHPYFAVANKRDARIDTRATRAFDNVTKRDVAFHGFDLTEHEVDLHLLDHGSTASALHLTNGERIDVIGSSDFVRWVVWTRADKEFVCLEPWTAPGNALNTGESLTRLAPGSTHESSVAIDWHASSP